ncbi:MAG: 5-(carboxyamino)imidazole ribonucleotide mutase [Candidatus Eisenbacteria bacterium]|uniref:N5-carboxyaminoimidazole ribonucleotide mutase n=1 Tax=Eiseniibacteriota bacterium TaxID=2212470 RepID=A0A956NFK2_UNCEI|nr:5-(carboxyamino)imidazole ribonucleotide mutase [Candidatus Eisenbacteria bacterium]MCB9462949.1 5-(carboxyamino)imidazole ribonucleotide mutase [Candidatus Eisenbacteria bacterium]
MSDARPVVGIVYGSPSDQEVIAAAEKVLDKFGVPFESKMMSAHRMPGTVTEWATTARDRGIKVIIASAGLAAHLGGVVAAHTTLPVLGVPVSGGIANGLDALLSMVQMPAGVPVGTLAVDRHGAKNAAVLAVSILSLSDEGLAKKLDEFKTEMAGGGRL